jgi:hypothetical protein
MGVRPERFDAPLCKSCRNGRGRSQEPDMDITTLLVIVLIIILLGGGGWYGRGRWY